MMKAVLTIALAALMLQAQDKCNNKKTTGNCYKGRLEIKAICSNYTIKVLEGNVDTSKISAQWTDEHTGKSYTNVFALDNPCSFPNDIEEGEEFYFTIREEKDKDCTVCLAYYPVPPKRLSIQVHKTPCP